MAVITPSDLQANSFLPDPTHVQEIAESAFMSFDKAVAEGYDKWIIMFSGGKDSTAIAILYKEWLKKNPNIKLDTHIVFSDTGVEIPTLYAQSIKFMNFIGESCTTHVISPNIQKSFWVLVAGKGYPAPHQKFRWCTDKLKISPTKHIVNELKSRGKVAIFTGVRFGESDIRDKGLYSACARGGECGQGIWMDESRQLGVGYFAPIAFWRQCDVWDYVNFSSYEKGYPTDDLETIYNGRDSRFGCWTCTVVQQDKTMQKIVETDLGRHLKPLLEFRNWLKDENVNQSNRVIRKNGQKGRLSLSFRRKIFDRIIECEKNTALRLISDEEKAMIQSLWNNPKYGDEAY